MKLSVGALFGSSKRSTKKKSRSILVTEAPSFGSNTTISSSSSSDDSISSNHQSTPTSVLPPNPRRVVSNKASSGTSSGSSDEYWVATLPLSVSELFGSFTRDGDGRITRRELEAVLRRLGPDPPTDEDVASIVAEAGGDGDGCISLEELGALGPPAGDELRDAFAVFDADGDGKISAEELLGVFLTLGDEGCTLEDCRRMIGGVDTDGDGFVCFEDFVRMMDGQR